VYPLRPYLIAFPGWRSQVVGITWEVNRGTSAANAGTLYPSKLLKTAACAERSKLKSLIVLKWQILLKND
jgi:hypothetical protein